ncbi:MAG: beta-lactamase family protein [Chromatiales bacterium]|nr:beta-lactamase family protein [Chromatiales bacterium]MDH3894152.1 beta-lactamase family protein [Chromatiales bacterium]MDH3947000.1 beta-lactamase family protein [Chromatiales bacterium]
MNCKNSELVRRSGFYAAIAAFSLLAGCGGGDGGGGDTTGATAGGPPVDYTYRVPGSKPDGWTVADAAALGMSVELLEEMINAIGDGEYPIADSVSIAYRGRLVLDETLRTRLDEFDGWVGNTDPAMHAQFSVSKSVAGILTGIAIDQGVIGGVDTAFLSLFDYPGYQNWDERKNDITVGDVLTMRLGFEWDEWDPPYFDPDNMLLEFYDRETDYAKGLLDLPLVAGPGEQYAYNTVASVSLGQAIENAGPLTLIDFGTTFLAVPLQIGELEVRETPTGLPDLGSGLYLVTRDMLKFGQLFADGGVWNGQRIVSEQWVGASTLAHVELRWLEPEAWDWQVDGYGYQWWTGYFEFDGRRLASYAARGYGQQVLMVIPELELVVAVNSHGYEETAEQANQVFALIARFIIPAVPAG